MRLNGYKKKYVFLFQIIEYVCPRLPAVRFGEYFLFIRFEFRIPKRLNEFCSNTKLKWEFGDLY